MVESWACVRTWLAAAVVVVLADGRDGDVRKRDEMGEMSRYADNNLLMLFGLELVERKGLNWG